MADTILGTGRAPVGVRPQPRWRLTPRSALVLLGAETRKGMITQWAHPAGHVIGLAILASMYLSMQFIIGQGSLPRDLLPQTLVAISVFWILTYASLMMIADLIEEKRGGTFAQSHLSPAPPWLIMLGRMVSAAVLGLIAGVIGTAVPALITHTSIPFRWAALLPYGLALLNVLAFTFLMAAIALTSPTIGELHQLTSALVIMLNGSVLPIAFYPDWLRIIAEFLPTTLGIQATNNILFHHATLGTIWRNGDLPWLLVYTVALGVAGAAIFVRNLRVTMRDGRLGQY